MPAIHKLESESIHGICTHDHFSRNHIDGTRILMADETQLISA